MAQETEKEALDRIMAEEKLRDYMRAQQIAEEMLARTIRRQDIPSVEHVERVEKDVLSLKEMVEALRRFEVKVLTVAAVLGSFGAIAVGISAWTLSSVMELRTGVSVLQNDFKTIREDVQRIREASDTLKASVAKLDTIVAYIEKSVPPKR